MSASTNFLFQLESLRRQGASTLPSALLGRKRLPLSEHAPAVDVSLLSRPAKRVSLGEIASGASSVQNWMASTIAAHQRSKETELQALIALQATMHSSALSTSLGNSTHDLLLAARNRRFAAGFPQLSESMSTATTLAALRSGAAAANFAQLQQRPRLSSPFLTRASSADLIMARTLSPDTVCLATLEDSLRKEAESKALASSSKTTATAIATATVETPQRMPCMPLASDEDPNWLSDFHCFVRKELVEICFATNDDVRYRHMNHKVVLNQLGLRCRHCHASGAGYDEDRAPRSVAYPSSIGQIYQSFTMMVREHFGSCTGIPESLRTEFMTLKKGKTAQGAINSKAYWEHSALAMGMKDSGSGIILTEESKALAKQIPPYGSTLATKTSHDPVRLVDKEEKTLAKSDYTFTLLEQVQRVQLLPEECRGNRKTLQSGLPGFACTHCSRVGRMGHSRVFPVKKRTLSIKLEDMYQHLMRCTVCPETVKEQLKSQREEGLKAVEDEKELYDVVWARLKKGRAASPVVPTSAASS
jgi:hypothetical protein